MKKAQFKDLSKFMVLAKTELLDLKLMQTVETDSDSLQEQSDQGIHCSVLTSLSASDWCVTALNKFTWRLQLTMLLDCEIKLSCGHLTLKWTTWEKLFVWEKLKLLLEEL